MAVVDELRDRKGEAKTIERDRRAEQNDEKQKCSCRESRRSDGYCLIKRECALSRSVFAQLTSIRDSGREKPE